MQDHQPVLQLVTVIFYSGFDQDHSMTRIVLPEPDVHDSAALTEALNRRRSVRDYAEHELTLAQVARLLWAAQGTNDPSGLRTAPSAGALYPLELVLVAGKVAGLKSGAYRYQVRRHALKLVAEGDLRSRLAKAALGQAWLANAAAMVVVTAVYERTTRKYGKRGERYIQIEVGHAAQNVLLQAAVLGLGAAVVGAFDDAAVVDVLGLPDFEHPLYLLPVGWPVDSG
jgi:SagB-type dehydrogenase family enzyme